MEILSVSAAKAKLNELVELAQRTHEHVTITRNGAPAAVMISADEWDSIQETLFWQSRGAPEDAARARTEFDAGQTVDAADIRRRHGLPPISK